VVTLTGDPGRRVEVRRRDELGRLATSFNAMLSALQRSLDAQRRLVSDASHELRTPLASLRLNADLLAEHPEMPAAERAEILGRVTGQAADLSRLVASITDLARGEPLAKDRSLVRFDALTAEALDAARRDWPDTEFDADLSGCTVNGSADRLRVAVRNLLDNAAKFGPAQGPVEVRLAHGELTVRDHGAGIDPGDLPFVFDRFYRALSTRAAPGAGLGLAVVHEIAVGHGGEVAAESAQGGGTLMRLTIPTSAPVPDRLAGAQDVNAVAPGGVAAEPGHSGDQEITEGPSGPSRPRPGARVSAAAVHGHSSWE
jgi:two-component system sensor histidine kinase MprB